MKTPISRDRIKTPTALLMALLTLELLFGASAFCDDRKSAPAVKETRIKLPEPEHKGKISLEESLLKRRSVRDYTGEPLKLPEVSQLLWAAQGITARWGGRTAPSAGALYPLEVYVAAGNVEGLDPGVYRYDPKSNEVILTAKGDIRSRLSRASLGQECVRDGAINIVVSAVYGRTTFKYGDRGVRYVHMEAGHAAQNVYLQATAMGLGSVTVGAFHDDRVKRLMDLPEDEEPLYIIPVGRPGKGAE